MYFNISPNPLCIDKLSVIHTVVIQTQLINTEDGVMCAFTSVLTQLFLSSIYIYFSSGWSRKAEVSPSQIPTGCGVPNYYYLSNVMVTEVPCYY